MIKRLIRIMCVSGIIGMLMGGCTGHVVRETVDNMDIQITTDQVTVQSPSVQIRGTDAIEKSPENLRR